MIKAEDFIGKAKNYPDEERINFIYKDRFVLYPIAKDILKKMEELMNVSDTISPPLFSLLVHRIMEKPL